MANNGSNRWMPTAGGVLSIVSGVLGIVGSIVIFAFIPFISKLITGSPEFSGADADEFMAVITISLVISGLTMLIPSIFAIIGGAFATMRKRWGWALAGSICAALVSGVLGIVAIVFIAMSKDEFVKINP